MPARPSEHGAIIIEGRQVGSTLKCPHCGGHFLSIPGSGQQRAFCFSCMAVTCGKEACDRCRPEEKMLEEIEERYRLQLRV